MEQPPLLSKKDKSIQWLFQHSTFEWRCIHCHSPLLFEENGFVCQQRHRMDMNKQGSFFLAHKSVDDKYNHALFTARRYVICDSPFYHALHEALGTLLLRYQPRTVLDAGCGEGSHLQQLRSYLLDDAMCVGVDLSKKGIQLATDYNGGMMSLVADLSNLPIGNQQVDVILSILSPSNYEEFNRVLSPNGRVIKVVPNENYLQEIRRCMNVSETEQTHYSNELTVKMFAKHYPNYQSLTLQEEVRLTLPQRESLVQMTPLTWGLSAHEKISLLNQLPEHITLDVTLLLSKA